MNFDHCYNFIDRIRHKLFGKSSRELSLESLGTLAYESTKRVCKKRAEIQKYIEETK